jgi:hypothetical protein
MASPALFRKAFELYAFLTITGFDQARQLLERLWGIGIMAAILQFGQRKIPEKRSFAEGHSATILIYNGVRHERLDPEHIAQAPVTEPARRAN